ncbi:hypothetical protein [Streptomyces sp. NPDC020480]|uniref:hypothetical protein n=1 Tax=Streptomyces sp. NPDC020480 TaxID=3365076 RepID=UPI00379148BA
MPWGPAIIAELEAHGVGPLSPEASAARSAYTNTPDATAAVAACSSGIELAEGGFADDVAVAVELNASATVPVLTDGAFTSTSVPGHSTGAPAASGASGADVDQREQQ